MTATNSPTTIVPPPGPTRYAQSAVDAIVGAYYPREVAAVDAARTRAQSAYAIASTLAGVLIGAGLLTTLDKRPTTVKAIGIVALLLWLMSAALYLRAVASPIAVLKSGPQKGGAAFVNVVLDAANKERAAVDLRLNHANRASFAALAATSITIALALFVTETKRQDVTIVLSPDGAKAVAKVCPAAPTELRGAAERDTLTAEVVRIEVQPGVCDAVRVTLQVPRAAISAMRSDG